MQSSDRVELHDVDLYVDMARPANQPGHNGPRKRLTIRQVRTAASREQSGRFDRPSADAPNGRKQVVLRRPDHDPSWRYPATSCSDSSDFYDLT
jgi:hypothetical protein